jgi:hypothetical protein
MRIVRLILDYASGLGSVCPQKQEIVWRQDGGRSHAESPGIFEPEGGASALKVKQALYDRPIGHEAAAERHELRFR